MKPKKSVHLVITSLVVICSVFAAILGIDTVIKLMLSKPESKSISNIDSTFASLQDSLIVIQNSGYSYILSVNPDTQWLSSDTMVITSTSKDTILRKIIPACTTYSSVKLRVFGRLYDRECYYTDSIKKHF